MNEILIVLFLFLSVLDVNGQNDYEPEVRLTDLCRSVMFQRLSSSLFVVVQSGLWP